MKRLQKLLSLLLALAMICGMVPLWAAAEEDAAEPTAVTIPQEEAAGDAAPDAVGTQIPTITQKLVVDPWVNPLYEDILDVDDLPEHQPSEKPDASVQAAYVKPEEAATQIRAYLKDRVETFTFSVNHSSSDYNGVVTGLLDAAMAHTGNPKEGDYLMWQFAGLGGGSVDTMEFNGSGYDYTFTITVAYYTTAQQEAEVDAAVSSLLSQMNVWNKSDYEKICAVYDYICANVTYDYEHLGDPNYNLQYTAYAALIHKTSVCQGYAVLFYRLMLELGVDVRLVAGMAGDEYNFGAHAWNIVELDGLWYNLDATWDAGYNEYWWFLNNTWNFINHYRYLDYETMEFHTAYPMAAEDYVPGQQGEIDPYIYGDYCGDSAYWLLSRYGELVIYGEGPMYDYDNEDTMPDWTYAWAEYITTVTIDEGITSIGDYSFCGLSNLTDATLPDTLTRIGEGAFYGCAKLSDTPLPEGLTELEAYAFYNCALLTRIDIPAGITEIDNCTFSGCTSVTEIKLPDGLVYIHNCAFSETAISSIQLPETLTTVSGFNDCNNLTEVRIPENVTYVSGFYDCKNLTTAYLDCKECIIGTIAFSGCSKLTTIVISGTVTELGNSAFKRCTSLTEFTVPDSVAMVGAYCFSRCSALTSIHFGSSVTTIQNNAFEFCKSLTTVRFPESVTFISQHAFDYCTGLSTIYFDGDAPSFGYQAFYCCYPTAYYPGDNETWTEDVMQDYGGTITWVSQTCEHAYESVITAPTCTEKGYTTNTCTLCGDVTVTDHVDALGHTPGEARIENEVVPTCSAEGGYDLVTCCTVCGGEASRETVTLDKLPHTPGVAVVEKEVLPTCSGKGSHDLATYCTECGEELNRETVILDKLPHTPGEVCLENEVAATCSAEGSRDEVTYCTECDAELTRNTITLDKLPHTYTSVTTAPTCTEKGCTTHTCTACGHSYITDEVDALGHDYTYALTLEPTTQKTGILTGTCSRCDGIHTVKLPALSEEDYQYQITLEPTEESGGTAVYTWNVTDYGTITIEVALRKLGLLLGDVNGDGSINTVDAFFVVAYYNDATDLADDQLKAADVSGDGIVNTVDAFYIVAYYNDAIAIFPAEE